MPEITPEEVAEIEASEWAQYDPPRLSYLVERLCRSWRAQGEQIERLHAGIQGALALTGDAAICEALAELLGGTPDAS